jgi:phospholipid/cholesterol/gamma-HCH transport system substrate-binding protein
MMQKLAPEIPRASERALEALDQTVVTLKALQKSFLLRGSVEEVRTEEALRRKQQDDFVRAPAESVPESKSEAKSEAKP